MAAPFRIAENAKPVEIMNPATDAAGRTGLWVNSKLAHKWHIVFHVQQGSASTILISLLQATSSSGGSSKATVAVPLWANQDTSVNDTLVIQTFAATFTTSATTKNKMVVFELDPLYLDYANSFQWITISTGASSASNITQAIAYGIPIRYEQATPPTMVT